MDKKELVTEAIASVKREDVNAVKHNNYPPGIYMEGELPQKKIKNAIDSFASDCMPEDVAALVEEDLLCSGKKGYLFTAEAMYYDRSRLDEKRLPRPLPYDQIMQVELGGSRNTHLVFTLRDGRQVDVYCGVRTNFLRLALKAILCALAGEMEPESDAKVVPEAVSEAKTEVVPETVPESDADADVILEVMSEEDIDVISEVMSGDDADADVVPETVPKAKEKDEKCIRAMELFQNGMKAYEADNYTKALSRFKQAAEQGYAEAQFKYGQMYYNGEGVEKDDAEAMSWFQKAAQQECAWAQFFCGIMYAYGKSVPRNGYEAMNWFLKAAEQGLARAQYECGARYYHEGNTDKNRDKAREWLEKAAAQGYEEAIKMLQNKFGQ